MGTFLRSSKQILFWLIKVSQKLALKAEVITGLGFVIELLSQPDDKSVTGVSARIRPCTVSQRCISKCEGFNGE